jgi:uncharacterized protein
MSDSKFDFSTRAFVLVIVFLVGLMSFWGMRMFEIYSNLEGAYPREISVEGQAKVSVTPDTAEITLGVNTDAATSEAAFNENTEKINKVVAAIKEAGIDEKDIKTTNYYMNPKYRWTASEGSVEDGYTANQSVEVKVRDFEKIGGITSAASAAGANTIGGVNFVVDDMDAVKMLAREEAIEKAKANAEKIADASGLRLGKVLNYYEYMDGGNDYGYKGMAYAEDSAGFGGGGPSIQPGQEDFTLKVNLSYRVK